MSALAEKLKELIGKRSYRQVEIATGVSHAMVGKILHDTLKGRPSVDTLLKLEDGLRVSRGTLLQLAGYEYAISPTPNELPADAFDVGMTTKVKVLGVIQAGLPLFAVENVEGEEKVPVEDVSNGLYFYLRVRGDSMIGDGILPGGLVLVRKQSVVEQGDIAVVMLDQQEATIKRVRWYPDRVLLLPSNAAYQPQEYAPDDVRIIGKVVEAKVKFT